MSGSLLDAAITCASRGWPVHPLHTPDAAGHCSCQQGAACAAAGKHPRLPDWRRIASTDPRLIAGWWSHWSTANIGVVTGTPGGIVAVDVDGPAGARNLLELAAGRDLGGLIVRTGRGMQLWFHTPTDGEIRNSAGALAPRVDIRGLGGYTIDPPSLHATGRRYKFAGGELGPMPDWLLKLVRRPTASKALPLEREIVLPPSPLGGGTEHGLRALEREASELRQTPEGHRNAKLNMSAFALGRRVAGGGLAEPLVTDRLTEAALDAGLPQREIAATLASGLHAGMQRPLTDDQAGEEIRASRTRRLLAAGTDEELEP